jgi:putative photosynthetic complex assembly protein
MNTAVQATRPVSHFPRVPLMLLASAVLATVVGVAAVRLSGVQVRQPDAATVSSRLLRFQDGPQGSVQAVDAASGAMVQQFHGEQGFLRGALRALARERRMREMSPMLPFELSARADGRLTLTDTATGARLDLESFGPTNAAVFARLLKPEPQAHAQLVAPARQP